MLTLLLAAAVGAKCTDFASQQYSGLTGEVPVLAFGSVLTDAGKHTQAAVLARCLNNVSSVTQVIASDMGIQAQVPFDCASGMRMTVNDGILVVPGIVRKIFDYVTSIGFIQTGYTEPGTTFPTVSIGAGFILCMGSNGQSLTAVGRTTNFSASYAVDIYDNTGGLKLSIPVTQSPLAVSVSKFLGASTSYYVAVMTSDSVTLYSSNGVVKDSHELKTSDRWAVYDMRFRDADHALVVSTKKNHLIVYSTRTGDTTTPLKQDWDIMRAVFNNDSSKMVAYGYIEVAVLLLVDTQTGDGRMMCSGLTHELSYDYGQLFFATNAEGVEMIMAAESYATPLRLQVFTVPAVTDAPATPAPPTFPPPTVAPPSSSTPIGAIIGGATGGVVLLIAAVVGFCLWKKRRTPTPLNENVEWGAPAPPTNNYVAMPTVVN